MSTGPPGVCPQCFETHRLTRICGEDVVALADQFAAGRGPPTDDPRDRCAAWVLGFARRPQEHLTAAECLWFEYLLRSGYVHHDAYAAFLSRPAEATPRTVEAAGHHLGTVGERRLFEVTVTRIESLGVSAEHPEYGERFVCEMKDARDNLLVWFTGENLALDVGNTYTVRARVEAHGEYLGRKQTRVSRLKEVKS